MATTSTIRHKHVRIDQAKLEQAKRLLEVDTDTEAVDRALAFVVTEAEIDGTLRRLRGKGRLKKVSSGDVRRAASGVRGAGSRMSTRET